MKVQSLKFIAFKVKSLKTKAHKILDKCLSYPWRYVEVLQLYPRVFVRGRCRKDFSVTMVALFFLFIFPSLPYKSMYIAIDFDGTCVTHDYPRIGKDIGSVPILKKIVEKGHKLILHTMRGNDTVAPAKKWFEDNNIPLFGVNYNPTQWRWTDSKKVFAQLYIDDAALGVPLKIDTSLSPRPFVDWEEVEKLLINMHII